jgi:hypothetical protein
MTRANTLDDIYRKLDAIQPDENGCKDWPGVPGPNGKARVSVAGKGYYVARLVLERKLGRAIRPGYFALHTCDWPACVNADHICEWTYQDNIRDKWSGTEI